MAGILWKRNWSLWKQRIITGTLVNVRHGNTAISGHLFEENPADQQTVPSFLAVLSDRRVKNGFGTGKQHVTWFRSG
jgi:hypothetical protein